MSVHFSILGANPSLIKCIRLPDILKDFQVVSVLLYNLFQPGAQSVQTGLRTIQVFGCFTLEMPVLWKYMQYIL